MPLTDYLKNRLLDKALRNTDFTIATVYLALHTGHPGASANTNEVTGGSYARQATAFDAAASGATDNTDAESIASMPDTTSTPVVAASLQDASTAGNGLAWDWLTTTRDIFTADDTTDVFTAPAHGMSDTNRVAFRALPGVSLPTGINETTLYFVRDATADTFKVALTSGGTAVNLTTDGAGLAMLVTPQGASAGHTFSLAAGAFDVEL